MTRMLFAALATAALLSGQAGRSDGRAIPADPGPEEVAPPRNETRSRVAEPQQVMLKVRFAEPARRVTEVLGFSPNGLVGYDVPDRVDYTELRDASGVQVPPLGVGFARDLLRDFDLARPIGAVWLSGGTLIVGHGDEHPKDTVTPLSSPRTSAGVALGGNGLSLNLGGVQVTVPIGANDSRDDNRREDDRSGKDRLRVGVGSVAQRDDRLLDQVRNLVITDGDQAYSFDAHRIDVPPSLGDIPYLGRLFRVGEARQSRSELIIFVTARLVPP